MDKNEIIKVICENYNRVSESCINDLVTVSKVLVTEKNFIIVKEGQLADKIYFIALGCARAYYQKDWKDITDWFAFENDFICSINSFFLNIPSPHFIEVVEPSILLEISKEDIVKLSDKYKEFDRLSKTIVTKIMLHLQQRIVSIQFETAQQKYEKLLQLRPDITLRFPLTHIASYLGVTLETLSRIRNPKKRI